MNICTGCLVNNKTKLWEYWFPFTVRMELKYTHIQSLRLKFKYLHWEIYTYSETCYLPAYGDSFKICKSPVCNSCLLNLYRTHCSRFEQPISERRDRWSHSKHPRVYSSGDNISFRLLQWFIPNTTSSAVLCYRFSHGCNERERGGLFTLSSIFSPPIAFGEESISS